MVVLEAGAEEGLQALAFCDGLLDWVKGGLGNENLVSNDWEMQ